MVFGSGRAMRFGRGCALLFRRMLMLNCFMVLERFFCEGDGILNIVIEYEVQGATEEIELQIARCIKEAGLGYGFPPMVWELELCPITISD